MESDFRNITIIGAGLIGGSLCRAIRRFTKTSRLYVVDRRENLDQLAGLGLADEYFNEEQMAAACDGADLIIIATPVNTALRLLPVISLAAPKNAVVTDVGSVKSVILNEAEKLFGQNSASFIGGHPMAGSEKSGALHSSPYLFENAIYSLSPLPGVDIDQLKRLVNFLHKLGARVVTVDAELHDRIAASVSHVPRILSVAMMQYIAGKNRDNDLYLKMAAGGFRDMTRIASGAYEIWDDIISGNRGVILEEMDNLIAVINKLKKKVENGGLQKPFEDAAATRLSIPADTRGFLKALYDVYVDVEDKPGVILSISSTLDKKNINIKDIEVLKVRENEGGSMRLAFSTRQDQSEAMRLLQMEGFQCSLPQ